MRCAGTCDSPCMSSRGSSIAMPCHRECSVESLPVLPTIWSSNDAAPAPELGRQLAAHQAFHEVQAATTLSSTISHWKERHQAPDRLTAVERLCTGPIGFSQTAGLEEILAPVHFRAGLALANIAPQLIQPVASKEQRDELARLHSDRHCKEIRACSSSKCFQGAQHATMPGLT